MVPEKWFNLQAQQATEERVQKMQKEAPRYFLDHTIHEVNDALTSILATVDTEAPGAVPKIKKYIQRVNQVLQLLKSYQSSQHQKKVFNVNAVVTNVLNVMEENFKESVKISRLITEVKGLAQGEASKFEEVFLFILLQMIEISQGKKVDILIELRQKDSDAMITIVKDHIAYNEESLRRAEEKGRHFLGRLQITPQGNGMEMIIRIPLLFEAASLSPMTPLRLTWALQPKVKKEKPVKGGSD